VGVGVGDQRLVPFVLEAGPADADGGAGPDVGLVDDRQADQRRRQLPRERDRDAGGGLGAGGAFETDQDLFDQV
jgi:hypothetical protein